MVDLTLLILGLCMIAMILGANLVEKNCPKALRILLGAALICLLILVMTAIWVETQNKSGDPIHLPDLDTCVYLTIEGGTQITPFYYRAQVYKEEQAETDAVTLEIDGREPPPPRFIVITNEKGEREILARPETPSAPEQSDPLAKVPAAETPETGSAKP
ncbi:MAG: hypothetical protein U1C49_03170 [Candidatus Andersenbacteria bacterium]|nr:hypothetical protein [bacterium]MDZ4225827.1 hypothetical protein [Candidatus Andersenbacteria bacterium]